MSLKKTHHLLFLLTSLALQAIAQEPPSALNNYGALTTINEVISNMQAKNEAIPINPQYSWQKEPAIVMYAPTKAAIPDWWNGTRPEFCYSALSWYVVQEAQGNKAKNTRVEIRNLRLYFMSKYTAAWSRYDLEQKPFGHTWQYPFEEADGNDSNAGTKVRPVYPRFIHGYGNGQTINPQEIQAAFVAIDFRLVVDDPKKADDRDLAKYVISVGADYWPGRGQASWPWAPGLGSSRMLLAKNEWRTATLLIPNKDLGITFEDLRSNPPPLAPPALLP